MEHNAQVFLALSISGALCFIAWRWARYRAARLREVTKHASSRDAEHQGLRKWFTGVRRPYTGAGQENAKRGRCRDVAGKVPGDGWPGFGGLVLPEDLAAGAGITLARFLHTGPNNLLEMFPLGHC